MDILTLLIQCIYTCHISDNRLYWCDSSIETSLLDGSNRRVLIPLPGGIPFGVAIFNADLYYTDLNQKFV